MTTLNLSQIQGCHVINRPIFNMLLTHCLEQFEISNRMQSFFCILSKNWSTRPVQFPAVLDWSGISQLSVHLWKNPKFLSFVGVIIL